MVNAIYPTPVLMLVSRTDEMGTVYMGANTFATKLIKWKGRFLKDYDLTELQNMGFTIVFQNGQPVLPYPHVKKVAQPVNIEA